MTTMMWISVYLLVGCGWFIFSRPHCQSTYIETGIRPWLVAFYLVFLWPLVAGILGRQIVSRFLRGG